MRHNPLVLYYFLIWLIVESVAACVKENQQPVAIGKSVTAPDASLDSLEKVLNDSPYTLFAAACNRIQLFPYLRRISKTKVAYTIFAPTDSAMIAAGYKDMTTVQSVDSAMLDSLVHFHIVTGSQTDLTLQGLKGTLALPTLLSTVIPVPFQYGGPLLYVYQLYTVRNSGLKINSVQANRGERALPASDGAVYPIDTVLTWLKPYQDMYQVLSHDTTFSFYVYAVQTSDAINNNYQTKNFGTPTSSNASVLSFNNSFLTPFKNGTLSNYNTTLLAPTNEAFRNAGLTSFAKIRAYCRRAGPAPSVFSSLYVLTPLDSILLEHDMISGEFLMDDLRTNLSDSSISRPDYNITVYDNLEDPNAGGNNYFANSSTLIHGTLQFWLRGGAISVQRKGSVAPAARITSVDIYATNGVIHPVDHLLLF